MTTNMRVKVRVSDLLKRVHAAKAKAVKDHEKALAKHEAAVEAHPKVVRAALVKALKALDAGKQVSTHERYRNGAYHLELSLPRGPGSKPKLDTSWFDKDISLLEMCSDEVLAISAADRFSRYL